MVIGGGGDGNEDNWPNNSDMSQNTSYKVDKKMPSRQRSNINLS